jgi:acyl carrier protein
MTERDALSVVRECAERLHFLDERGELVPLDSFAIVDLVLALEAALGRSLRSVTPRSFTSLATLAEEIQRG